MIDMRELFTRIGQVGREIHMAHAGARAAIEIPARGDRKVVQRVHELGGDIGMA